MVFVGFQSDKGKNRTNNEDAYFVLPKENIYVIADGVGGNRGGEIASKTAVTRVAEYIKKHPLEEEGNRQEYGEENSGKELREYFSRCLDRVNGEILKLAEEVPENSGMATTLVICYVDDFRAYFVNIGDSRAYLFREGNLIQITEDHSYVNTLVKMGAISKEEAKKHQRGHMITKALGADKRAEADYYKETVQEGDVLVLCTDGLYGEVSESEMCRVIKREEDMSILAKSLVAAAKKAGGRDDTTVICLKLTGGKVV